jgi:hypothetical protein
MAGRGRANADPLLIVAVAQGKTRAEAAEAAGVSEHTLYRRLKDPVFNLAVEEAQEEIIQQAVGLLATKTVVAVATLGRLATEAEDAIQLKAALEILDRYPKLRDEHRHAVEGLERTTSHARQEAEKLTVDQAVDMILEAHGDPEQMARAKRLIEASMDLSDQIEFEVAMERGFAWADWTKHRPHRTRSRPK